MRLRSRDKSVTIWRREMEEHQHTCDNFGFFILDEKNEISGILVAKKNQMVYGPRQDIDMTTSDWTELCKQG